MSTLPCFRSSASVTEKPLDTLISILGNSSLRIRVAGASQAASCPVRKPTAKIALAGRAARRAASTAASACVNARARVIEKGAAGRRQFDAAHAAGEKRGADFLLEVPHLAAEGGLRRMQAAFRRELHAARLGDGDEIAKMPELHPPVYIPWRHIRKLTKSFSARAARRYSTGRRSSRIDLGISRAWIG